MLIGLSNVSKLLQNPIFCFQSFFDGHFCYHSNDKSQNNTRYLHLGYCSNKLMRRKCWKMIFIFSLLGGGKNSLLTHVPLYRFPKEYWSGPPGKSPRYPASIQYWAVIGTPAKRHLNGVLLTGRSWPAFSWILGFLRKRCQSCPRHWRNFLYPYMGNILVLWAVEISCKVELSMKKVL